MAAPVAGEDTGAGAFGTADDEVDVLGVGGGKVVQLTEDFGFVVFDEPAHQLGLDDLALGDGEGGAAGSPPGGDAVVADALGSGVEEVGGAGGEVELATVTAGSGAEESESVLDVGELLLEVVWHELRGLCGGR